MLCIVVVVVVVVAVVTAVLLLPLLPFFSWLLMLNGQVHELAGPAAVWLPVVPGSELVCGTLRDWWLLEDLGRRVTGAAVDAAPAACVVVAAAAAAAVAVVLVLVDAPVVAAAAAADADADADAGETGAVRDCCSRRTHDGNSPRARETGPRYPRWLRKLLALVMGAIVAVVAVAAACASTSACVCACVCVCVCACACACVCASTVAAVTPVAVGPVDDDELASRPKGRYDF
ncbi:uncharacterized protein LY79DRAFT_574536 [Colletotrichum navitas]|uniref:Uncharacterized protein n=1 Tax=Colletotrichum navitas TaxID=681940 RepID=A0AAD8VA90_9PEZI|nr:uncharacterized protein LY79DRAFT_574536 [Colletotrichum navitas]KAK1600152.1 hypothetical protein LY79DRAFT_574536 [Colletotrichum navitas]